MDQGSPEWFAARRGFITASRFGTVLYGTAREKNAYLAELRGEAPPLDIRCEATSWGHFHEAEARRQYELHTGEAVIQTGFVKHFFLSRVGCSPDGLVIPNGGLEIKCPFSPEQTEKQRQQLPLNYLAQAHGGMWVCDAAWWDVVIYDPRHPDHAERFHRQRLRRDESYIKLLAAAVEEFKAVLECDGQFDKDALLPSLYIDEVLV